MPRAPHAACALARREQDNATASCAPRHIYAFYVNDACFTRGVEYAVLRRAKTRAARARVSPSALKMRPHTRQREGGERLARDAAADRRQRHIAAYDARGLFMLRAMFAPRIALLPRAPRCSLCETNTPISLPRYITTIIIIIIIIIILYNFIIL